MTFVPHNGFHNQVRGLENAIVVAWFLNRTLILPPALLGIKFSYDNIKRMANRLKAEPVGLICENIEEKAKKQKCQMFHNSYTLYPFDQIFDFTFIRQHIKVINIPDYKDKTVFKMLNITEPRKEAYFSITTKQNNVLYDTETKPNLGNIKNGNLIIPQSLEELKKRPEKLLYFGSLFGSHRVMVRLKPSKEFFKQLRKSLVLIDSLMLSVVSNIVEKLGGAGGYISVHARGGDGDFKARREIKFSGLIKNINKEFPEVSRYLSSLKECPLNFTKPRNNKNRILYVASDLDRSHESMKVFLEEFPCLKMLPDFIDQLKPYEHFINPVDNKIMYKYLIPLTDLMVAANGLKAFTINSSTYGAYMQRYHSILFKKFKML